jgi:hypothetical protein
MPARRQLHAHLLLADRVELPHPNAVHVGVGVIQYMHGQAGLCLPCEDLDQSPGLLSTPAPRNRLPSGPSFVLAKPEFSWRRWGRPEAEASVPQQLGPYIPAPRSESPFHLGMGASILSTFSKGRSKTSQKTPPVVGVYTVRPSTSTNSSLLNRASNPRALTAHVLALIRATSSPGTILSRSGILAGGPGLAFETRGSCGGPGSDSGRGWAPRARVRHSRLN